MSTKSDNASKRQLIADAILAASEGRWNDSITLNNTFLERFPRDAEALNRKGRALIELRDLVAARDSYTEALKADPANMIARRNLQRLEMFYNRQSDDIDAPTEARHSPRSTVFVEEVGRTWVDELTNPADLSVLAEVSPGEQLVIQVEGDRVVIVSERGTRLGEVGDPIGQRLVDFIAGGNRYEVYALGISSLSLRVILREVFKDPSQSAKLSFPEQVRKTQDLMRERELLFLREESDFIFGDDEDSDDDGLDAEVEPDADEDDDEEPDAEASEYVGEALTMDHDDERDAM